MNGSGRRRVAVIGSGFGGAILACRLAEAGRFDVHVLERGARYARGTFPRSPEGLRQAFWEPGKGGFGLFEYRSFARSHIDVLTAAGVGGGSLIYSNVLYRMPEEFFDDWPGGLRREMLDPYYDRALGMLEASPYPVSKRDWPYWSRTPKARALAEVAAKIRGSGRGHPPVHLEWPPLAVQFGPEPGREIINQQGVPQTACVMCGECNIGCNFNAKNTLDLNYLARAVTHGAQVHTHARVSAITPRSPGEAGFDLTIGDPRYALGEAPERTETYDLVVLAAGSLGSTELALRMRADTKLGRTLSKTLGTRWSPNGDLLGWVQHEDWPLDPSSGPVITGALHVRSAAYADGFAAGAWVEDGGIPGLLAWYILGRLGAVSGAVGAATGVFDYLARKALGGLANVGEDLRSVLIADRKWTSHTLMMLAMGRDRATGVLDLSEPDGGVHLRWDAGDGEIHYQRTRAIMSRVAEALGGQFVENVLDDVLNRYVSVHPVGGLPLGDDIEHGTVDARTGELFGCKGLFVVDGSILPGPVGPNPALTIAALAELYAERLCHA